MVMVYIWPAVVSMPVIEVGAAAGASLDRTTYWGGANVNMSVVAVLTATGRLSSTVLASGSKLTMV